MTVHYDIKQVARYVLTRSIITDKGPDVVDLAVFTRRDDAERVMGTMRAAIHPVATLSAIDADRKAREDAARKMQDVANQMRGG